MGGLDVSCGNSDRCPGPGRPRCCTIQFGQIELNRSGEGYSGQAQFVADRAADAEQAAADFSGHDKHRHFCRSSGGTVLVRHPGVCAVC